MNVFLDSIGCRLNQSEIERMALQFRAAGHNIVGSAAEADLVVVNTCAVTGEAASDSRGKIRQAARLTRGHVHVTGCWATLEPQAALALPRVTRVTPNAEKDRLVPIELGISPESFDLEPLARQPLPGLHQRTRAFLKVQDGCDNHCTFCVTRIARGAGRSRTIGEVLTDVRAARAGGAQEVVLTGVHLGSWGQDLGEARHLRDLVSLVLRETDVPRVRLSSLEPWDLDEDFFSLWQDPRLCRHLHLPLQSGSANTLRKMARKTTPAEFRRLVELARQVSPDMAITTDVIVGFPGESEADFAESLAFVKEMAFAGGHVFHYSVRAGTAAARMGDQVPMEIRKQRSRVMRAALAQSGEAFNRRFIGSEAEVLWESTDALGPQGWRLHGLNDQSLRVSCQSPERLWNTFSKVRLERVEGDRLWGTFV